MLKRCSIVVALSIFLSSVAIAAGPPFSQIQLRRDTATAWTAANPVLAAGEVGVEIDTLKFKIGNGSTSWNSLAYKSENGTDGTDGKSILSGTVDPTSGVGNNGDFYINTSTSYLFGPKASGSWPAGVSLVGPPGPGLTLPLSISQGGTGQTTAANARSALGAAGSGNNSDITALTNLTTPLAISLGGTSSTSSTAAFNALDPLTTKGDTITNDGTNSVRLPVGSNGQVLTADSTQILGIKWASQASAPVDSVNGQIGVVVLDTDDISEGSTNLYFLNERAQDAVGGILTDTASVDFTYDDPGNSISATVSASGVDKNLLGGSALSIANGGTGQTTATTAFDALDPLTTKGDLISNDGTNSVRVGVGSNGQILTADSTQTAGVKWATPTGMDPFAIVYMKDDFPSNTESDGLGEIGWTEETAGTAATVVRKNGISGHPGIITLRPGTVATGRAAIALGGNGVNNGVLGDGTLVHTWLVRSNAVLTQMEEIAVGLGDTSNAVGDQPNGVYFRLLAGDTNWFLVSANASSRTASDTGIAYAANTWIKLKFTVNASGTSIQANVNGVDVGAPITTNIPTVAISPMAKVDGIAGGVASDTDIDVFESTRTLTTPR